MQMIFFNNSNLKCGVVSDYMVYYIVIEPELLESLHWGLDYNLKEIAKILGCDICTIRNKMKKYNIEIKPYVISDETRKKKSVSMMGKNKGKIHSEETRKKNSERHKGQIAWNKGIPTNQETIEKLRLSHLGQSPWNKGITGVYKHSDKSKEKISNGVKNNENIKKTQFKKGDTRICGENNHCWQGGISFEPYGLKFNKYLKGRIRERDNRTCQECGMTEEQLGYSLCVHHIDYNKQNNNENNLICLCKSCHCQTNFDRDDWKNYFLKKRVNA